MTVHTGTVHGGTIELDDAPDLPDGRRVRVTVEPAETAMPPNVVPTLSPSDPRPGIEQVAGRWAEHADDLEEHVEYMRRLRQMTREEARRLRGEE